jgi:hypothetical protein
MSCLAAQRECCHLFLRCVRIGRSHLQMLRHTFVTTMLDAGVDLGDVQIAARHADSRTTMRYDRARQNLDRHPNYILAARRGEYEPRGHLRASHDAVQRRTVGRERWSGLQTQGHRARMTATP